MSDLMPLGRNALTLFQAELIKDEKILWSGQPEPKLLNAKDWFLIPFGIIAFIFSIFWTMGICRSPTQTEGTLVCVLIGVPLIMLAFHSLVGRFFVKSWRQKNTYYAVTNQRILILRTAPNRTLQAVYINTIPVLHKSTGADGIGTIEFSNPAPKASMYANSGMEFLGGIIAPEPAFYDVKNVDTLYELINSQRKK